MTNEQREAIDRLKDDIKYADMRDTVDDDCTICFIDDLDTAISLIKQLESEKEIHIGLEHQYKKEYLDILDLTKKYKRQIDLMAEQLAGLTIWDTEKDEPLILGDKEAVINYFENKVNSKIQ